MTAYLVSSILWAVGGFLLGYGMGRIVRDVEEVRDAVIPDRTPATRLPRPSGQTVIGVIVVLVAAASTVLYAQASANLSDTTACQAAFNEQFRDALVARADAASAEADAQRELLTTFLDPGTDQLPGASEDALRTYIEALDRLEETQARNPLPERLDCR